MEIDVASFGRAALYLGVPFVLLVFFLQWKWARTCERNIQVLVAQQGGGGSFELAQKAGGSVSIKNPVTNTTRTWPINELATIDVTYPGVGFVPKFLQKTIRLAIVNEGDWEPLLNRSAHMKKVASPDMVSELKDIAEKAGGDVEKAINKLLDGVSTSPTRELIASPAVLGNLMKERISEIVSTVSKEIYDPLKEIVKKLGKPVSATIVYIGLGLIIVLLVFMVIKMLPALTALEQLENAGDLANDIALIKQALGITQ